MKRFWIKFEKMERISPLNLGCGVTAPNVEDAIQIVKERIGSDLELPKIVDIVENIDITTLDSKHVLPNMGNHFVRGIWFPMG
jgi:hypothetical protein